MQYLFCVNKIVDARLMQADDAHKTNLSEINKINVKDFVIRYIVTPIH